ncbi:MAG: glycosyltransferase family 4 protein [Acidiferrobacteraceae bacterium]
MRIAFDHQIFGWQQYGGISRYVYELARNLSEYPDHQVRIVAPLHINQYIADAGEDLNISGMRVPDLPKSGPVYRMISALVERSLLRRWRPDIVHETYYAGRNPASPHAKIIITVYDMIQERLGQRTARGNDAVRQKLRAVQRADHIICISQHTREDLMDLFSIPEEKTSVVYLGFSLTQQGRKREDMTPAPNPYLLFVGNRGGYKNFTAMLKAYAQSKILREHYDLLCFGGGRLTAGERRMVAELGLRDDAVRQYSGGDNQLSDLYHGAAALIYPSLYEGFGIPPLEAMSADCPVACSNASALPEVVGDAAELFDPRDLGAIQQAMERVVGDPGLRDTLIKAGRGRIRGFSWARCAQETLAIYEHALS